MEKPTVGSKWRHRSRKIHYVVAVWGIDGTNVAFENIYGRDARMEVATITNFLRDFEPWH